MKYKNLGFRRLVSKAGLAKGGQISSYPEGEAVQRIAEAAMVSLYTVTNWINGQARFSEKNLKLLEERLR